MDIVYIYKCQYEIQELKEVPTCYAGIYRLISIEHWVQYNPGK
jgi:hypothetical protein